VANYDHPDNIGTHPAFSKDPETALRARLDAARTQRARAEETYMKARNNLRVFLGTRDQIAATMPDEYPAGYANHLAAEHIDAQQESQERPRAAQGSTEVNR
jgi:outer membrane protein TolC